MPASTAVDDGYCSGNDDDDADIEEEACHAYEDAGYEHAYADDNE